MQATQETCFHTDIRKKFPILQEFQKIMDVLPLKLADTTGSQYNNLIILGHIGSVFSEITSFTASKMCAILRKFAVLDIGYEAL